MNDLTKGSITRHLLQLSAFLALTMVFQTLYFLADLYWVGRLGKDAIAAVSLSGNLLFVIMALTQTLGVGTTTLISHAAGQKDHERALLVFNQAFALSQLVGVAVTVLAFIARTSYCRWLAPDTVTAALAADYLLWFIPALGGQFAIVAMASGLRATGIVKPTVAIQVLSVLVNIILAPVLIFGWGLPRPLGVTGAALASFIAILVAVAIFYLYFRRKEKYLRFVPAQWKPQMKIWKGLVKVGLPAGGEFALTSVYLVLIYWIIRDFGSAAQAGFGIGGRLMQAMFLPTVAVGFAAAPLVGQNFGARNAPRVRQSFYAAVKLMLALMVVFTAVCQLAPAGLIRFFSHDPQVVAFGVEYLRIISWNFVAFGLAFVCSSVFQGIGNTVPPLAASSLRVVLFAVPAYWLSRQPGFGIREVWYLSVASVTLQAIVVVLLLRREFRRTLNFAPPSPEIGLASAGA